MKLNKRIVFVLIATVFASGSFAAAWNKTDSEESFNLCNSGVLECNLSLKGNGGGYEPPILGKKKKEN